MRDVMYDVMLRVSHLKHKKKRNEITIIARQLSNLIINKINLSSLRNPDDSDGIGSDDMQQRQNNSRDMRDINGFNFRIP